MKTDPTKDNELVISYLTLRKAVGWLGVLLPFVLLLGNCFLSMYSSYETDCNPIKSSISHYYYTRMGEVFVGTLCAVSLFLFCYKGPEPIDGRLSNFAAVCALGVVLFPTSSVNLACNLRAYEVNTAMGAIHFVFAALFFITLACISLFLFTKSKGHKTVEKIKRNRIYRACGYIMFVTLILIFIYVRFFENEQLEKLHPVFWLEAVALAAFGFSWLTKGEFLLKDKDD
ncbi:MAG: hypothetical protein M0D57_19135 [Sphingobacteriales bacterium JAD_PAG50586_3]|nr:MAG: hypothetical protein M0D57_19135 [Sphingobacteriales bacterium JAD_PAG50586_3]